MRKSDESDEKAKHESETNMQNLNLFRVREEKKVIYSIKNKMVSLYVNKL